MFYTSSNLHYVTVLCIEYIDRTNCFLSYYNVIVRVFILLFCRKKVISHCTRAHDAN